MLFLVSQTIVQLAGDPWISRQLESARVEAVESLEGVKALLPELSTLVVERLEQMKPLLMRVEQSVREIAGGSSQLEKHRAMYVDENSSGVLDPRGFDVARSQELVDELDCVIGALSEIELNGELIAQFRPLLQPTFEQIKSSCEPTRERGVEPAN